MNSPNFIVLDKLANEAISACDSAIRFINDISRQYSEDDHEPLSWDNNKRSILLVEPGSDDLVEFSWNNNKSWIARFAESYCDLFAKLKIFTDDVKKEFEATKQFNECRYKKCKLIDRDIFFESNLFESDELRPFLVPVIEFIYYYIDGYEGANPEKIE